MERILRWLAVAILAALAAGGGDSREHEAPAATLEPTAISTIEATLVPDESSPGPANEEERSEESVPAPVPTLTPPPLPTAIPSPNPYPALPTPTPEPTAYP